jgi:peptidoglycan/LPS O-acetylase OafA/YrhL
VLDLVKGIPDLLKRKTSSGRFLPKIDGLRFVAISTVLVVHIGAFVLGKSAVRGQAVWFTNKDEHLPRDV